MITLSDGTTTTTLHPDLYWSDELAWNPVEQTAERTITGALLVSTASVTGGRPITLEPENDGTAWMPRATVEALRNWAAVPGQELTLTLRAQPRTVIFRHQDGGLSAQPVVHYSDTDAGDWYLCTLRFLEL